MVGLHNYDTATELESSKMGFMVLQDGLGLIVYLEEILKEYQN